MSASVLSGQQASLAQGENDINLSRRSSKLVLKIGHRARDCFHFGKALSSIEDNLRDKTSQDP